MRNGMFFKPALPVLWDDCTVNLLLGRVAVGPASLLPFLFFLMFKMMFVSVPMFFPASFDQPDAVTWTICYLFTPETLVVAEGTDALQMCC